MKKWFFSYRNNDISCTDAKGHATLREIFDKMCNLMCLGEYFDQILSVAYLGFHFGGGGGVQKFSGKVGVFAWRSHAFARGVRGMLPRENF